MPHYRSFRCHHPDKPSVPLFFRFDGPTTPPHFLSTSNKLHDLSDLEAPRLGPLYRVELTHTLRPPFFCSSPLNSSEQYSITDTNQTPFPIQYFPLIFLYTIMKCPYTSNKTPPPTFCLPYYSKNLPSSLSLKS